MEILKSASKIVLIVMTFALIGLTLKEVVDPKDFVILTSMIFSFYFGNKSGTTVQQ